MTIINSLSAKTLSEMFRLLKF